MVYSATAILTLCPRIWFVNNVIVIIENRKSVNVDYMRMVATTIVVGWHLHFCNKNTAVTTTMLEPLHL